MEEKEAICNVESCIDKNRYQKVKNNQKLISFHISNVAFSCSDATMTDWVVAKKMQSFQTNLIPWKEKADKILLLSHYEMFPNYFNSRDEYG